MLSSSRRTLLQALIISVLIHAVLLLGVACQFSSFLDVPATTISVVMNRDSANVAVKTARSSASRAVAEPVKSLSSASRSTPVQRIAVQEPSSDIHVAPVVPTVTREAGPASAISSSTAVAGSAGGRAAASTASTRESISADDMRQYRMALAAAAKRFKRYPALARERGWEGTVDVALDFSSHVPIPAVVLVQSSGRGVLDEQALEMVAQAARVTFLPEGLKGRDFRVQLPIKYSLEGD